MMMYLTLKYVFISASDIEDDDVEYFRQEVGQMPDTGLLSHHLLAA